MTEVYDKIKGHAVTQSITELVNGVLEASLLGIDDRPPHRHDISAGLYEIAIAQAIEGPHNPVSRNEPLEELRVQKWVIITERKRKKRLRQARAVIDLIKSRSDTSAGLIEAAEWLEQRAPACYAATTAREWAAELRREVAVRARAADRSGK